MGEAKLSFARLEADIDQAIEAMRGISKELAIEQVKRAAPFGESHWRDDVTAERDLPSDAIDLLRARRVSDRATDQIQQLAGIRTTLDALRIQTEEQMRALQREAKMTERRQTRNALMLTISSLVVGWLLSLLLPLNGVVHLSFP